MQNLRFEPENAHFPMAANRMDAKFQIVATAAARFTLSDQKRDE